MSFKKSLKDVIVLLVICVVFTGILAATNAITAPIIAGRLNAAAGEAYKVVMPDAKDFKDVDLTQYAFPSTVKEVKEETSGIGYVVKLENKGYADGLMLVVGLTRDAKVINVSVVANNETPSKVGTLLTDNGYNLNFQGKDLDGAQAVDTVAGVTYTTRAYRDMVVDAINSVKILGGEQVDARPESEKFQSALEAALPEANGVFTKYFKVEIIEGIDSIYVADNGAGYVCVIGTDSTGTFIGVGADGVALGENENNAVAETAIAKVMATKLTELQKSDYDGIHRRVQSIHVTDSGNYIFEIKCDGHGVKGDPTHEHASGERYIIKVCISADGIIIDSQTLEHSETPTWGGPQLEDGAFNANFIGKNETESGAVDIVAGTTNTTAGYKEAILRCFAAYQIIIGGTTNE